MAGLVARMRTHKEKCKPLEQPTIETDEGHGSTSTSSEIIPSSTPAIPSNSDNNPINSAAPKRELQMSKFVVKTTSDIKTKIDIQLGRAIYATNTSFLSVEHPEFIKLFEMLRPGYKLPNQKQIGGKILETVFESEKHELKMTLCDSFVCMSFDGWSNVRNESILGASVTNDAGSTFFVDSIDASGISETSDNLTTLVQATIKKTEDEFGFKVLSFVTDNCNAMVKMRKTISENSSNEDDFVISYGCNSHWLNLLAKSILTKVKSVSRIVGVSKCINVPFNSVLLSKSTNFF